MKQLSIGASAYSRKAAQLPQAKVENYYWEKASTSETGEIWIPRPGTSLWYAGNGALRGIFRQPGILNGDIFAVIGTNAYRINSSGTSTLMGTISGTDRVSIAGALSGVMVANGTNLIYCTGSGLLNLTIPFTNPVSVSYLDGYWNCVAGGTFKRYRASDLTPTVWNALAFDSASEQADGLICSIVVGSKIWDIGEKTIEFRYSSGDLNSPFIPLKGASYHKGCIARDSVVALDNTAIWVGDDNIIYRGGSVPEAISDNFISELIGKVSSSELYAFGFPWDGHVFYCLTIGTQGTYLYDLTTQKWSKWLSYNSDRWLSSLGCIGWDNKPIIGDVATGNLYKLSSDIYQDDDLPIIGTLSAGFPIKGRRISISNLRVEMATGYGNLSGLAVNPKLAIRYSRDNGNTYGNYRYLNLGAQGQYEYRVVDRRLGQFKPPAMIAEVQISEPIPHRISGIYVDGDF